MTRPHIERAALGAFLVVALVVGLYGRFAALGSSPLAIDEYYLAQSIQNILASSVPMFECGGYYVRGLLQQYLTAGLQIAGMDIHIAIRLVAVFANLAAIPAVFLLARRLGGVPVAILTAGLFSLSIWEIEFARFGRMYAPFQAVFLWYCLALVRAYHGSLHGYAWAIVLALASVFVYEGGVLLLAGLFVPLLGSKIRGVVPWAAAGASLLVGTWLVMGGITTALTGFATAEAPPQEQVSENAPQQEIPANTPEEEWNLPLDEPGTLSAVDGTFLAAVGFGVALLLTGLLLFFWLRNPRRSSDAQSLVLLLWGAGVVWLSFLGLYAVIVCATTVMVLWQWLRVPDIRQPSVIVPVAWSAVSLLVWTAEVFMAAGGTPADKVVTTLNTLFRYPDLDSEVLYRWLRSMPALTFATILLVGLALILTIRRGAALIDVGLFRFVTGLVIVFVFAVAILPQPYATIRYTYFLHPLVLALLAAACAILAERAAGQRRQIPVALALVIALIVVTDDYDVRHIARIGSKEILYRVNMNKWQEDRMYRRWDYRSPAEYVNTRGAMTDTVLTPSQAVPFYLDRLDYFYIPTTSQEYETVASCNRTRERWSNAALLSSPAELSQTVEERRQDGAVWAILRAPGRDDAYDAEAALARDWLEAEVYRSADGRLAVFRIPPSE